MQPQTFAIYYTDPADPKVVRCTNYTELLKAVPPEGYAHEVKTFADLCEVPMKVLLALYNRRAEKKLVKFEDKQKAAARVMPMMHALADDQPVARPPEPKAPREPKAPKPPGRKPGVCAFIAACLKEEGKMDDTDYVLARVKAEFPDSRAGRSDVSIVRGKIKKGVM